MQYLVVSAAISKGTQFSPLALQCPRDASRPHCSAQWSLLQWPTVSTNCRAYGHQLPSLQCLWSPVVLSAVTNGPLLQCPMVPTAVQWSPVVLTAVTNAPYYLQCPGVSSSGQQ